MSGSLIIDSITDHWINGRKTRQLSSGWITGDAPCCQDTRKRGGLIAREDGISFHCFNCKFKASWKEGYFIDKRMDRFLHLLNMNDDLINRIKFTAFRLHDQPVEQRQHTGIPKFPICSLPEGSICINTITDIPEKLIPVLEYMKTRQLFFDEYQYYWSPQPAFTSRLIIPFFYRNQIIGYTARSIKNNERTRYLSSQPSGYVFNVDKQADEKKFIIVTEGPIDAIGINGCSILGSNICSAQRELLESFSKEIIVVPDRDDAGQALIEQALEYKWSVAMVDWPDDIKDINDAVVKIGRLATLWKIITEKESTEFKIRLRAKTWRRNGTRYRL